MGRIARLRYFLSGFFGIVISFGILFVLVSLWGIINLAHNAAGSTDIGGVYGFFDAIIPILTALALLVPMYVLHAFLAIQRCHDLGWTDWCYLLVGKAEGARTQLNEMLLPTAEQINEFATTSSDELADLNFDEKPGIVMSAVERILAT